MGELGIGESWASPLPGCCKGDVYAGPATYRRTNEVKFIVVVDIDLAAPTLFFAAQTVICIKEVNFWLSLLAFLISFVICETEMWLVHARPRIDILYLDKRKVSDCQSAPIEFDSTLKCLGVLRVGTVQTGRVGQWPNSP